MRNPLFTVATIIAASTEVLSRYLFVAAWFGGLIWAVLVGSLTSLIMGALWFVLGPILIAPLVSVLRLPFILLGLGIAALAGRTRDYFDFVASLDR